MRYQGLCEGTYAGKSLTPAADRCKNLYPETLTGAGSPEAQKVLIGTPGTVAWLQIGVTGPVQHIYAEPSTGDFLVIVNQILYRIKTFTITDLPTPPIVTSIGTVGLGPYTMSTNGAQVMISCVGDATGWIFNIAASTVVKIVAAGFFGTRCNVSIDGYFISSCDDRRFQISSLLDGTLWNPLDYAVMQGNSEAITSIVADHGELWLFGNRHAEVYQDTGNAGFPFERIRSIFIPHGLLARQAVVSLDNAVFWLGTNEHGQCRVFRADGYVPRGVSNRSIEYFFNMYAASNQFSVSDATMYGYQNESGHTFLVINFPSANQDLTPGGVLQGVTRGAQWVYDITENEWHERSRTDQVTGKESIPTARFHAFSNGRHVVGGGDPSTSFLFLMREDIYLDFGMPIKRVRRAPHIVNGLKWINYNYLRLSAQVGTVPTGETNTTITLKVSNDGGMTWTNGTSKSLGLLGDYKREICWRRLGRAKRRAFELSTSIAGPVCIIDAEIGVDGEQ